LILNDKDFYKDASIVDAVYQSMQQMPGSIHLSMFLKCIEIMGSEEQKKIFIEDCWVYKVIGCYAQTEIGHGSDIQGLETQATFI
jgi:acyl-CoA oxidase